MTRVAIYWTMLSVVLSGAAAGGAEGRPDSSPSRTAWYRESVVSVQFDNHSTLLGKGVPADDLAAMLAGVPVTMLQVSAQSNGCATYPTRVGRNDPAAQGYDTLATFKEIIRRYDPDGFWFDGDHILTRPCWCDSCLKEWKADTGTDFNPPLERLKVSVPLPAAPSRVRVVPTGTVVKTDYQAGKLNVLIETMQTHAALILDGEAATPLASCCLSFPWPTSPWPTPVAGQPIASTTGYA